MSGGSPLTAAQQLYVMLHEAEEQTWELREPATLLISGLLRQAIRLLLDAEPDAAAGLEPLDPGASYEPKPYDRFDSPELQAPPGA